MLDLISGFRVLQVDLAFPHLFHKFHPQNLPNFALDLTSPRGVLRVRPRIPSPDIRPDSPDIRPLARHPAPDSITSILHSVYRLTFDQFCPGAHIHFRISPVPHSTTIALPATNSDNFDPFCFENLSCGFRVLLCFGYLGTVRHQHHHRSSSPRTTTNGYITLVSPSP